MSNHTKKDKN